MADEHDKPEVDDVTGVGTTGHEWDGIKELDNPLPRWWVWIFYASIVWSVIYMIFMPALPAPPGFQGHTEGLRNHSERANVAEAMDQLRASRADNFDALQTAVAEGGVAAVESDPDLLNFALAAGRSAFGDNCATCHGSGAQGFIGYPNLNDDAWLWGGTYEAIRHTLEVGIRSEHPDTRFSQMPAYGRDGLLTREEIDQVTAHVLTLSGREPTSIAAAEQGAEIFDAQCAACHMADGTGDRTQGAPNLTDDIWLYGGEPEQISDTIWRGPYGVMPYWEDRLEEPIITSLAVYVYLLGGGEEDEFIEAARRGVDGPGTAGGR
ncbi:cytochrome-c oxidase, cbb3-type subunit III [Marinicauda salina]|uniref:Cbb3-type cytochrome c oxidase subunit n=1 Tax=Marinicauda salina TaxID=2135793 RepID=A0A2U2BWU1_9PROT|nr:cytochrome-c oxidase, cbb3-type subunit III [Marinicauda salina]PWE18485.1 cytochrome-c oxidase, cbb3-type subunit III [Marinicauda salina]